MRLLLIIGLWLALPGCTKAPIHNELDGLSGQPSWFPLGGEVYRANARFDAQAEPMGLMPQPRWFLCYPRVVTEAEYRAWEAQQQGTQSLEEGIFMIPQELPFPESLSALPRNDQGATLDLIVQDSEAPGEWVMQLTLATTDRDIYREVEHRWTNITPFLFALFADGKAVRRELAGFSKMGGAMQWVALVEPGGQKTWTLRVATESIRALAGDKAKEVAIVAAFSERQHEAYSPGHPMHRNVLISDSLPRPQIVVRSNVFRIHLDDPARPVP